MKITSIEKFPLDLRSKKEGWANDEFVWPSKVPCVVIKINTEEGIVGFGEATSQVWYLGETQEHILKVLDMFEERLIGEDSTNLRRLHEIMDKIVSGGAPSSKAPASAVDMAALDINGKAQNKPVYEVIGGAYRTEFDLLTNLYVKDPEEMVEVCKKYEKEGFKGLKVKVGDLILSRGWSKELMRKEVERLVAVLEATPEEIDIDADANQGWRSPKLTVDFMRNDLAGYTNLSIEQPLHYFDLSGHSYVRNAISSPLILDESVLSPEMMIEIIKNEAADRIDLKLNRVGGLGPGKKIADIAESAAIGVSVDTNPFTKLGDTALCHLAATIQGPYPVDAEGHISFLEELDPDPFQGGVTIDKGKAKLPDSPGLGIEVDEEKLLQNVDREN